MVIMALWYNGKLHYPVKVEMVGSIPPRVASFEAKSFFSVTVSTPAYGAGGKGSTPL